MSIIDRLRQLPPNDVIDEAVATITAMQIHIQSMEALKLMLATQYPEKSGYYFVCGESGEKNVNGLPEKIHVCPQLGVDWFQIYERKNFEYGP